MCWENMAMIQSRRLHSVEAFPIDAEVCFCVDTKEKDLSDRIKAYQNIVESGVFQ